MYNTYGVTMKNPYRLGVDGTLPLSCAQFKLITTRPRLHISIIWQVGAVESSIFAGTLRNKTHMSVFFVEARGTASNTINSSCRNEGITSKLVRTSIWLSRMQPKGNITVRPHMLGFNYSSGLHVGFLVATGAKFRRH